MGWLHVLRINICSPQIWDLPESTLVVATFEGRFPDEISLAGIVWVHGMNFLGQSTCVRGRGEKGTIFGWELLDMCPHLHIIFISVRTHGESAVGDC